MQQQPKNSSGAPAAGPKPWAHLPEALRSGGAAYKALTAAGKNPTADPSLLQRLKEDLTKIRNHASLNTSATMKSEAAMMQAYRNLLHDERAADLVLCYCLALAAEIKISEEFATTARGQYAQNRARYDAVLTSLIPEGLFDEIEDEKYRENQNGTALGDWAAFCRRLETRRQQPLVGQPTGFTTLDAMTGGLRGVTLCAGPTGSGKTTLALNLILGALRANDDAGALFFSLEMPKEEQYLKLLSHLSRVEYKTICAADYSEQTKLAIKAAKTEAQQLFLPRLRIIDSLTSGSLKGSLAERELIGTLKHTLKVFVKEARVRCPILVVDSLQKLPVDRNPIIGGQDDGTHQRKSLSDLEIDDAQLQVLIELQCWTRSEEQPDGVPVFALSRVNKAVHSRRLILDDVPGKADIVHEATNVFLLQPAPEASSDPAVTPSVLNIAKVRDGGRRGDIHLNFHHTVSRFSDGDGKERHPTTNAQNGASKSPSPKPSRFVGKARPNSAAAME